MSRGAVVGADVEAEVALHQEGQRVAGALAISEWAACLGGHTVASTGDVQKGLADGHAMESPCGGGGEDVTVRRATWREGLPG
ncbi:hypothetical protein [Myxococcus xanthus]|uniref:hypothetical protein n=1 Tax=Myxococcus xanthus TaxID=34 RepID=UPI001164A9C7|nr:hypothetical protein [Myxococcus xanthus]QDE82491.1 hypothetical protein BHS07_13525 [Myxococcus xanthus]